MAERNWQENNVKTDDDVWDKEMHPELEGKLTDIERNVGPNESTLYTIEKSDGAKVKVWGSTVLDDRFLGVPENTYIKITYEGKVKGSKGTYYHNYKVFVDADSMPQESPADEPPLEMPPDFLKDADD